MRELRACRAAAAALALVLGSCSILVDPGSQLIKCEITPGVQSTDPCGDSGMHCVSGVCQACAGTREDCNGVDDDCDGLIDEGHDQDGDGYTWCGGGVVALADCVDTDPTIHPNGPQSLDGKAGSIAIEICDGKDNDCNGMVDELPECKQAQSCTVGSCAGTLSCDTATGQCIAPLPVGSGCKADTECEGGFCMKPGDFGLAVSLTDARCATACCSDSDCSAGSACLAASSGAHVCLPSNVVSRGTAKSGARCSDSSECASGFCSRVCRDLCNTDMACGADNCILSPAATTTPQFWMCGRLVGLASGGQVCTPFDPIACKSGWCLNTSVCARPCGRNADCDSGQVCTYADVPILVPGTAAARLGICKPESATTADTLCCTSADCGGQLCRPKQAGMRWNMVCVAP